MEKSFALIITTTSCGMVLPDQIVAESIEIRSSGDVFYRLYNGMHTNPKKIMTYWMNDLDVGSFSDFLFEELRIVDWDDDYSVVVCDGWSWEMSVYVNGIEIKRIVGTVRVPDQAEELIDYIKEMVDFEEEPWIIG